MDNKTTYKIGYWAAVTVTIEVAVFALLLVIGLQWTDTKFLSFGTCWLLALSYVTMISCVYQYSSNKKKIWGNLGVNFGIMYAVLCSTTYYVQFAVIRNNNLQLPDSIIQAFTYSPGSFIFALNMLGYAFLCLSTLAAAPVFYGRSKREIWLRRMMIFHGLFAIPTIVFPVLPMSAANGELQQASQFGSFALLFWCIIFIPIPILISDVFKDMAKPIKPN